MSEERTETAGDRLPGDLTKEQLIDRIIRVDHAGEFGAKRIYEGQLAVLRGKPEAQVVEHMYAQELEHLKAFEKLMVERRARPSALHPIWNVAGFALGAATALMSEEAAMACTEAVETEIDRHYGQQLAALGDSDPELAADIAAFRADEVEHRDTARDAGAARAPGYPLLTAAIRAGCRVAIELSKRI